MSRGLLFLDTLYVQDIPVFLDILQRFVINLTRINI